MNTISINASSRPLVWRFAWKEYRMLRGFWLACAIIAVLIQLLIAWMSLQSHQDIANALFMVAWSGAALYAVGAAITMFAAETEERTRDYLRLLPGDWKQIFATKVAVAFASAVLLGVFLSLVGWSLSDRPLQGPGLHILGVAGIAVVEFLAWGLLFSLWWKHPLLAAVAAIAAASFGAQWAIVATTDSNNSWTVDAYVNAVPGRLAVCLVVFAVDVWLGRGWFYPVPTQRRVAAAKTASGVVSVKKRRTRLKMFGRLLWQTWRESWLAILVAVPMSIALVVVALIPAYVSNVHDFLRALPFVSLVPPALLGALAFRADQQRDHRLFLATHAAWPRNVWLARHVVWLAIVVAVGIIIYFSSSRIMQGLLQVEVKNYLEDDWQYYTEWLGREFSTEDPKWAQARRFEYMQRTYERGVVTSWVAFLTAYAVGQLCSMLLKQTLLSGFLAILFAIVIAAWSVLMYLWEMDPLWFVLPIGVAALLATWLRTPSWILHQNQFKHWVWPVTAVVLPLVSILALVPATRMAQLSNITQDFSLDEPFAETDQRYEKTRTAANQTALEYERLAAEIDEHEEELLKAARFRIDLPYAQDLSDLAERVSEITMRPHCQLPAAQVWPGSSGGRYLEKLLLLLLQDGSRLQSEGELDLAFERLCAELRLLGHMLQNMPSWQYSALLQRGDIGGFEEVFAAILDWAQAPEQTSARLKEAIKTLDMTLSALPQPADTIYTERERARQIILEKEPPSDNRNQLAAALNRLPGEQRRALRALDIVATQAQRYANLIEQFIAVTSLTGPYGVDRSSQLRSELRSAPSTSLFTIHPRMFDRDSSGFRTANQLADACATSFLVAEEFRNSGGLRNALIVWTDFVAQTRGLCTQLAVLAYRVDHGAYPESLDELVPDYLPRVINDPYSGEAFQYRREGLNLPLIVGNEEESRRTPHIPPGTPLLWSVGLGNNELKESSLYRVEYDWIMGSQAPVGTAERNRAESSGRAVLKFYPTEGFQREGMWYVFPLPKIEAEEDAAEGGAVP